MAAPLALREDYDASGLRSLVRRSRCAEKTRRLLALVAIYDGSSRGEAARLGDIGLQTIWDWVLRFNTAGPARLITRKPPGKSAIPNTRTTASTCATTATPSL